MDNKQHPFDQHQQQAQAQPLPSPAHAAAGAGPSSLPSQHEPFFTSSHDLDLNDPTQSIKIVTPKRKSTLSPPPPAPSASVAAAAPLLPPPPPPSIHGPASLAPSAVPESALARSDTLSPSDSISMYEERRFRRASQSHARTHKLDPSQRLSGATLAGGAGYAADEYPARKSGVYHDPYTTTYNQRPAGHDINEDDDDDDDYPRKSYGGAYPQVPYAEHPDAHLPLNRNGASMGYAENEEDEARQLKDGSTRPAGLFSHHNAYGDPNGLHPGVGVGAAGAAAAGAEAAQRGLLGKFGRKSAGAESDMSKVEQQVERRRAGVFRQKYGILAFLLAIVYIIIFIVELIRSKALTGQAFQTTPRFQPMIGPPFEFFIAFPLGARFVPCMRNVPTTPTTLLLPCLNATTSSSVDLGTGSSQLCPIWELCGLQSPTGPFQGYRFITAMFIHAGVIHLLFNVLAQLTLVVQVEKILGTPAFALVYFAGGIGGNLLGGNFGLMSPALGASGAVYTAVGVEMTDLILNWQYEARRKTRLTISVVFAVLGLALGLLPGLDNFSHIGGFICGILGGLAFGPSIHPSTRHRVAIWIVRLVSLGLMIGFLAGLASNFYKSDDPSQACRWCRYLSCLPAFSQCRNGGLQTTSSPSSPSSSSG